MNAAPGCVLEIQRACAAPARDRSMFIVVVFVVRFVRLFLCCSCVAGFAVVSVAGHNHVWFKCDFLVGDEIDVGRVYIVIRSYST